MEEKKNLANQKQQKTDSPQQKHICAHTRAYACMYTTLKLKAKNKKKKAFQ